MIRAPHIGWSVPVGIALAAAVIWYVSTRPSPQLAAAKLRAVATGDDYLVSRFAPKGPGRR